MKFAHNVFIIKMVIEWRKNSQAQTKWSSFFFIRKVDNQPSFFLNQSETSLNSKIRIKFFFLNHQRKAEFLRPTFIKNENYMTVQSFAFLYNNYSNFPKLVILKNKLKGFGGVFKHFGTTFHVINLCKNYNNMTSFMYVEHTQAFIQL